MPLQALESLRTARVMWPGKAYTDRIHLNTDAWHEVGAHLHIQVPRGIENGPSSCTHGMNPPTQQPMAYIVRAVTSSCIPSHSQCLLGNTQLPMIFSTANTVTALGKAQAPHLSSVKGIGHQWAPTQGTAFSTCPTSHRQYKVKDITARQGYRRDVQLPVHHKNGPLIRLYQARISKASPPPYLEVPPCY